MDSEPTPTAAPPLASLDLLRAHLAAHDEPCPNCHYNLRHLTTDRCPECNQLLILRVNLVEPRLGSYLALLSGLLAGWGAATIFLGVFLFFTIREGLPPARERLAIYGIPSLAFLVLGVPALLLARQRGRAAFRTWPFGARAACILAAWIAPILFIIWFFHVLT